MYGTRVHAGPEAQIHRDKKNTKTQEAEIQSQGHKTLMYGTRVHAGPELKSTGTKKKHQTTRSRNPVPRTQNPNVWN
jgi:hypothetical protein